MTYVIIVRGTSVGEYTSRQAADRAATLYGPRAIVQPITSR